MASNTNTNNKLITTFDDIALPPQRPALAGVRVATQGSNSQSEREPTQYWLNVGVKRGDKLVSLPMGIPLDKLTARKIPSQSTKNPEFRQLRLAEADLWKKIQTVMGTLQPGQTVSLKLDVEIRRIDEQEQVEDHSDSDSNPFAVGDLELTA